MNAWPLDEGLIDYVDGGYGGPTDENQLAALNVIANPTFPLSGTEIDATAITPALLRDTLHDGLSKEQGQVLHEERNRMDAEQGSRPHDVNAPAR